MAPPHHLTGQLQNPFEEQQSLILQRICGNVVRMPVCLTERVPSGRACIDTGHLCGCVQDKLNEAVLELTKSLGVGLQRLVLRFAACERC